MKFTARILSAAALLLTAQAQTLGPYPRAFPDCGGITETVTIDFSRDAQGKPLSTGDSPTVLPEDIVVSGQRRGEDSNNDLVVFDTSRQKKHTENENLAEFNEGGVLIIGADDEMKNPDEAVNGGRFVFRFRKSIYQLTNIRALSVNKTRDSYITGRDSRGRRLDTFVIPTRGDNNDTTVDPSDWYDVRLLEIVLGGVGAISELMITVCRGNLKERCAPGARLTRGGFCRPCPAGTFLADNTCLPCEGDSVAPVEGAETCTPCDPDDTALSNKKDCRRRCPVGQFRDETGTCQKCPIGSIRARGDQNCSPCGPGTKPNEEGNQCIPDNAEAAVAAASIDVGERCQPGFFRLGSGRDRTCEPCPEGTFTNQSGTKHCSPCAGGFAPNAERTACVAIEGFVVAEEATATEVPPAEATATELPPVEATATELPPAEATATVLPPAEEPVVVEEPAAVVTEAPVAPVVEETPVDASSITAADVADATDLNLVRRTEACLARSEACNENETCCTGSVCRWDADLATSTCQCQAAWGSCGGGQECCDGLTCQSVGHFGLCVRSSLTGVSSLLV